MPLVEHGDNKCSLDQRMRSHSIVGPWGRKSYGIVLFTELPDISFDYILIGRLLYIRVLSRSQDVYTNPSLGRQSTT
ncbi:hypothetical protein YC2023_061961 [Brassica napus]|uniref:Uncharacterized protein n=1 Tax=Brassica oleracea TaxID=3712 RepID=A0A3P6EN17_BRAOL|nr:unnamed protein product [Brassica oleracea]